MKLFLFFLVFLLPILADTTKVSLQLSWLHQFQFAGYYMAIEKGYYKDVAIELSMYQISEKGKFDSDFYISKSSVIVDSINDQNIIALGALFQHSPLILLALKDSNITEPEDLINKRVMITDDAVNSAAIMAMLRSKSSTISKINLIPHSYNLKDLILRNTDVMASYVSNEPIVLDKLNIPYTILDPKKYGFDFYDDILTTTEEFEKLHPKLTKDFYEASIKGWNYAFDHIDETAQVIYLKYNPQNKTLATIKEEGKILKTLVYDHEGKIGTLDPVKLAEMASVFKVLGFIQKDFIPDNFIYRYNAVPKIIIPIDTKTYYIAILSVLFFFVTLFFYIRDNNRKNFIQSLIMNMGEGVYSIDRKGECIWINKAALDILGYSEEEILHKPHETFHHHTLDGKTYHKDHCPVYLTLKDRIPRESEEYFIHKDGTFFPVSLTISPIQNNGVIAVFKDMSTIKQYENELKYKNLMLERVSKLDSLTKIPNRRCFDENYDQLYKDTQRDQHSLIVMMVDIDFFKQYNDTYGHTMGDKTLIAVSKALEKRLKRPSDIIARYGGEEFIIALKDMDRQEALRFATSLVSTIQKLTIPHKTSIANDHVTISIGISHKPFSNYIDAHQLIKQADEALYIAKSKGRNQAVLFGE